MGSSIVQLHESPAILHVFELGVGRLGRLMSSATVREICTMAEAGYTLLCLKDGPLTLGLYAIERLLRVAVETDAAMVYADRYQVEGGEVVRHPVIDYSSSAFHVFVEHK